MVPYIIFGIVVLLLLYILIMYNTMVKQNNKVKEAFSTMDVYLKKRWDLIPNIVESVKGYVKHEKDTLQNIVNLRNGSYEKLGDNEKVKINNNLSSEMSKLMLLVENYPDLKSSANFLDLSSKLEKVEEDIANSRKYYNAVVKNYNNKIQVFPNNLIASLFGYRPKDMFIAESNERESVKVELQ